MRLLLIGCEYTEKQTLAVRISQWMIRTMGVPYVRWHDHFVVPRLDGHMIVRGTDEAPVPGKDDAYLNTADDEAQILTLRPGVLEQLQRHMIWRHLHPDMYRDNDVLSINHYYADAVYAPIYHGYGQPGSFSDRLQRAREWDMELLDLAPDTVLVHMEAAHRQFASAWPRPQQGGGRCVRRTCLWYCSASVRSSTSRYYTLRLHWTPQSRPLARL